MSTVVNIPVTDSDLEQANSGAGAYATLPVPADFRMKVTASADWLDKATKKIIGWAVTLTINEDTGFGLPFKYFLSFEKERRAKMIRFFEAAGKPLQAGSNNTSPDELVELEAELGGRIDFPRKYYTALQEDGGEPGDAVAALGPIYREVRWVFPLTELPDEAPEPETAAVPVLE
jgi:hypothetical protein